MNRPTKATAFEEILQLFNDNDMVKYIKSNNKLDRKKLPRRLMNKCRKNIKNLLSDNNSTFR